MILGGRSKLQSPSLRLRLIQVYRASKFLGSVSGRLTMSSHKRRKFLRLMRSLYKDLNEWETCKTSLRNDSALGYADKDDILCRLFLLCSLNPFFRAQTTAFLFQVNKANIETVLEDLVSLRSEIPKATDFSGHYHSTVILRGAALVLPASCDKHLSVFLPECIPSIGLDVGSEVENTLSSFVTPAHAAAA